MTCDTGAASRAATPRGAPAHGRAVDDSSHVRAAHPSRADTSGTAISLEDCVFPQMTGGRPRHLRENAVLAAKVRSHARVRRPPRPGSLVGMRSPSQPQAGLPAPEDVFPAPEDVFDHLRREDGEHVGYIEMSAAGRSRR